MINYSQKVGSYLLTIVLVDVAVLWATFVGLVGLTNFIIFTVGAQSKLILGLSIYLM